MIINNQKYSCEACIRGHRVTTCKHHDRPLTRINRKGRPFSTCTVCHRTPCQSPDEHGRLRRERDDIHKKPNRYTRPFSGFLPIAPRPRPRPRLEPEPTSNEPVNRIQSGMQEERQTEETRPEMQTTTPEILDFPFDMEFELPLDDTGINTDNPPSSQWPYPEKGYGWDDIPISTPVPVPVPVPVPASMSVSMPMPMPMSMSIPWDMTMKGLTGTGIGTGTGATGIPANEEWMRLGF